MIILIVSAILRILLAAELAGTPAWRQYEWQDSDMNFFHTGASQIASGDILLDRPFHPYHNWHAAFGTPEEWRKWYGNKRYYQDPGYYYLAAVFHAVFADGPSAMKIFQLLIGLATIWLAYFTALRMFGKTPAVITAALLALCGPLYFYDILLLRATMLTFSTALFIFVSCEAFRRDTKKLWVATGAALGFAFLLKSTALLYLLLTLAIILWFGRKVIKTAFVKSAIVTGVFLAVLLPLFIRNASVGAPVFSFSSVGPATFILGNGPESDGDGLTIPKETREIMRETNGEFWPVVFKTYKSHGSFLNVVGLWFKKAYYFFRNFETPNNASFYMFRNHSIILTITFVGFWLLTPLMFIGIYFAIERVKDRRLWLVAGTIDCLLIPTMFFFFVSRYRLPAAVPFAIFGGLALSVLYEKIRQKNFSSVAIAAVIGIAIGVFFNIFPPRHPGIRASDYGARAIYHLNRKNYDSAAAELKDGLEAFPGDVALSRTLGESLIRLKKFSEAENAMTKALEHHSGDVSLRRFRALSLMALNRDKEAVKDFSEVLKIEPDDQRSRIAVSNLLVGLKRYDEAAKQMEILASQNPDVKIIARLVECHVMAGNLSRARAILERYPGAVPHLPPHIVNQLR